VDIIRELKLFAEFCEVIIKFLLICKTSIDFLKHSPGFSAHTGFVHGIKKLQIDSSDEFKVLGVLSQGSRPEFLQQDSEASDTQCVEFERLSDLHREEHRGAQFLANKWDCRR